MYSEFCTVKKKLQSIHTLAQLSGCSILFVPAVVLSPHNRPACRTVCPCSGEKCEAQIQIHAPHSGSLGWSGPQGSGILDRSGPRGSGSLGPSRRSSQWGCPRTA